MEFRYSALSDAHTCLQKYKLRYLDKVSGEGDASIDLEFGTAMHAAIQASLEGADSTLIFSMFWDSLQGKKFEKSNFSWEAYAEMGLKFLAKFERLHKKKFKVFKLEERIQTEIAGFKVAGTPDFLGDFNGIPSVVDFKTSNYSYRKEKIRVNEQMPLYAHMAKQAYGFEAKQLVYLVFNKREESIQTHVLPLTKKLLDGSIRNVILMMSDLTSRCEFPKNPNNCTMGQTYTCPYFSICHGSAND